MTQEEAVRPAIPIEQNDEFLHFAAGYSVSSDALNKDGYLPTVRYGINVILHSSRPADVAAAPEDAAASQPQQQPQQQLQQQHHSAQDRAPPLRQSETSLAALMRKPEATVEQAAPLVNAFVAGSVKAMGNTATAIAGFWSHAFKDFEPNFKAVAARNVEQMQVLPVKTAAFTRKWAGSMVGLPPQDD
ncbi:hypothetical protein JKP88DRAFT_230267 [Tribonema minus]|uniref:Uncharacterized protein n=1 Tax=Tribonema minus TaxID=303371 RepID=A0A835ZHG6_9STRA|nr:hypothetical protein JKP88DRAFT_230267 [Tribonema minus]